MALMLDEDGWGMTALKFTPISINHLKTDLEIINYEDDIQKIMLKGLEGNSKIHRLEWDENSESCMYLIENENEYLVKSLYRKY